MARSTITSKGQTTIPQEIRSFLKLHAGDKIEFIIEENGKVVIKPLTNDILELKGALPKPKKIISIKQMNKVITKRGSGTRERN